MYLEPAAVVNKITPLELKGEKNSRWKIEFYILSKDDSVAVCIVKTGSLIFLIFSYIIFFLDSSPYVSCLTVFYVFL